VFSWPANYDSCYTLAGVISREGIGLHSGEKTRVKISSYEKEGFYVSFRDKPNDIFKLTQDLIGSTMLCTAVKLGGRNLYTIEHLLSSLAGCGLSYIHIEVDGREIPLLDGSAIGWVRAFEEVGIKKVVKPDDFFSEINKSIILNILFFSKISKSSSSKLLNLAERKSLFFFIEPIEQSLKLLVFFDFTNTNFGLFSCGLIFNSKFS